MGPLDTPGAIALPQPDDRERRQRHEGKPLQGFPRVLVLRVHAMRIEAPDAAPVTARIWRE
jgi:hypothetical protein